MKKVEKTENQLTFTTDIGETLTNSIRRYVNHVNVMAIDEVEISKNDSPLYDETISHRLGLIPLKNEKSVNEKSTGKLKLSVSKGGTVYSGELKGEPGVVYKEIPITTLAEGQEIEIVATVRAGRGAEHAKFSPGMIFYRNVSEITLDKEFQDEVEKSCPSVEIKEKGNKIVIVDNKSKEVADVCEGISSKKKKKAEIELKDELVVTIESFGQMPVEEIFKKSVEALEKDLNAVAKSIDKE